MVPYVYPNLSRDFQVFLRYYNYIFNGIKHDIDQIKNVIDTEECNNKILYLLQSKVGFFSNAKITDDELRYVLAAFPYIIKNKGSRKAISQAINVFCKINKITSGYKIIVYNKDRHKLEEFTLEEREAIGTSKYVLVIELYSSFKDTTILTEMFRYILPPAYDIVYMFMSDALADDTVGHLKDELEYIILREDTGYNYNMKLYNTNNVGFTQEYNDDTDIGVEDEYQTTDINSQLRSRLGTAITENFENIGEYFIIDESTKGTNLEQVTEQGNSRTFSSQFVTKIINYNPNSQEDTDYGHRVGTTQIEDPDKTPTN